MGLAAATHAGLMNNLRNGSLSNQYHYHTALYRSIVTVAVEVRLLGFEHGVSALGTQ